VGAISGISTVEAIDNWYKTLNQPSFNPPDWLFAPVWTTLYILMGISFFLIWKEKVSPKRNKAIYAFLIQLALNFCWSFIFFNYKMPGYALFEIILLWTGIAFMIVSFFKVKPLAGYLNISYLLWVTFATALNTGYYLLN